MCHLKLPLHKQFGLLSPYELLSKLLKGGLDRGLSGTILELSEGDTRSVDSRSVDFSSFHMSCSVLFSNT